MSRQFRPAHLLQVRFWDALHCHKVNAFLFARLDDGRHAARADFLEKVVLIHGGASAVLKRGVDASSVREIQRN